MKNTLFVFLFVLSYYLSYSQIYTEKQTRHRFAQLNLGLDIQSNFGGSTKYINGMGNIQSLNLSNSISPRLLFGGTHFWGHADFYIAIPLFSTSSKKDNQEITALRGVETVFKYYPLRIEHNKVRPYIGTSLAPFYFEQRNNNFQFASGPELSYTSFPLLGGLTYNAKNHLIELGLAWNYQNQQDYYISRSQIEKINTPPFYATLSYRYMLETTLGAEKDWESGRTKEVTEILANKGRLNGFYVGAGISSAFWLKKSDYNQKNRAYINLSGISIMPDFTLGYYWHKPDLNLAIGYRGYSTSTDSYGASQQLRRQSMLLETTKFLFDYHGFVPFVGPAISYENLSFIENFEGNITHDKQIEKFGYGLTFGWDIRAKQNSIMDIAYEFAMVSKLKLEVEPDSNISFDNLEFNFYTIDNLPR